MMTIHPEHGPQDTVRGQAGPTRGGSPRYLRSEPLDGTRTSGAGTPGGLPFFAAAPQAGGAGLPFRLPRKSVALAGGLALLLGPLGMIYGTFFGALVMAGVVFWSALLSGADAAFAMWVFGALWSMWAAHRRNRLLARFEENAGLTPRR